MGWFKNMVIKMLKIQPARDKTVVLKEPLSFTNNVLKNRMWYHGDPSMLSQYFKSIANDDVSRSRFWAATPSNTHIRKMHSGLPAIMADRLSDIVIADLDKIEVKRSSIIEGEDAETQKLWDEIAADNEIMEVLSGAIIDTLVTGDGAFKISIDTDLTQYPIIEFYSGEQIEYVRDRGRLKEVIFYDYYTQGEKEYRLKTVYGRRYIDYTLYDSEGREVDIKILEETKDFKRTTWTGDYIMAVPLMFFKSKKYPGRGKSIYDAKSDSFDALDETISQWVDAIRDGRVNKYIPENLIPKDPETGEVGMISSFDNKFIKIKRAFSENDSGTIDLVQAEIKHEAYANTYANDLDKCTQGIISPSTLGIDLKKTDNATSQREKEKTTLYSRGKITDSLTDTFPKVITLALMVYDEMCQRAIGEYEATIEFGEYAAPTFNEVVSIVGEAATNHLMSVETKVETLWRDSKSEDWKAEEVARIKAEQGIVEMDEPGVNMELGGFVAEVEGGSDDEGADRKETTSDGENGGPGTP